MTFVAVDPSEVHFVSSGLITSWSCICALLLSWWIVASSSPNEPCVRSEPLAGAFQNNKKLSNLIILPMFLDQDSVELQYVEFMLVQFPLRSREPMHGTHDLARILELDTVAQVLRI